MKKFTDLYTIEEFIEYYKDAKRVELKRRLKSLQNKNYKIAQNEKKAITTLLA